MRGISPGQRAFGLLTVLVGGLMAYVSAQEVIYYFGLRVGPVVVGTLGILAGLLFIMAGTALFLNQHKARFLCVVSAAAVIGVHAAGLWLRYMGVPGILFGILYPALLLWITRPTNRQVAATPESKQESVNERQGPRSPLRFAGLGPEA